ncbi:MAG: class C sortase [Clostridia bacterium]|nr:class C sortase [Clostridia bacterium]
MIKKISTIVMLSLFFIGLSVLLYPAISSYWNSKTQSQVVESYENMIQNLSKEDSEAILQKAEEYNQSLRQLEFPLQEYGKVKDYHKTLNLNTAGMMGYISIDSIGVELPIYHTVSESVLAFSAGHMEGTSLPVGGESTHSVLSAHRGLPNAKLFTDLDKVQVGDTFTVTIMDTVILYQVDQILTVTPENTADIQIVEGEDYCTLLTCTPYGINSHRLLVRGKRIDTIMEKEVYIANEAYQIDTLIVTPIVALPILLVLILVVLFQPVKQEHIIEGDEV